MAVGVCPSALNRRVALLSVGAGPCWSFLGGCCLYLRLFILMANRATALGRADLKYTKILYSPIKTSKRKGTKNPRGA